MKYGVNIISQIAMRILPSEKSEMVSQLLFGEVFKVITETDDWINIISSDDNYIGWVNKNSVLFVSEEVYENIIYSKKVIVSSLTAEVTSELGKIIISQGSSLPLFENGVGQIDNFKYSLSKGNIDANDINKVVKQYVGAPYLWGGRTFMGIDCSGLIMNIYKSFGVLLPRDASAQVEVGDVVNFLEEAKSGDLCFFDNSEGEITHVGMILDKNQIIHSSSRVRIDKIDHVGIYNEDIGDYSHKLRVVKRILK